MVDRKRIVCHLNIISVVNRRMLYTTYVFTLALAGKVDHIICVSGQDRVEEADSIAK
jgi:hypothetical protein